MENIMCNCMCLVSIFVILQTLLLSRKNAKAHRLSEHLSFNLQIEVDKQTKELKSKTWEAIELKEEDEGEDG